MSTTSVRTPFLDADSFAREEMESVPPVRAASGPWSPFLSVYEADEGENQADQPLREAYAALVNDLYDEEFDEALFELLTSARDLHEDHLASGHSLAEADRIVTQHFSQLMRESEVDDRQRWRASLARAMRLRVEREFETFAERYVPATPLEPEFEDFLGKLVKKIGKGVEVGREGRRQGRRDAWPRADSRQDQGARQAAAEPGAAEGHREAAGRGPADWRASSRERLGLAPKPPGASGGRPMRRAGDGPMAAADCRSTPPEPALASRRRRRLAGASRGRRRRDGDAARVRPAGGRGDAVETTRVELGAGDGADAGVVERPACASGLHESRSGARSS